MCSHKATQGEGCTWEGHIHAKHMPKAFQEQITGFYGSREPPGPFVIYHSRLPPAYSSSCIPAPGQLCFSVLHLQVHTPARLGNCTLHFAFDVHNQFSCFVCSKRTCMDLWQIYRFFKRGVQDLVDVRPRLLLIHYLGKDKHMQQHCR